MYSPVDSTGNNFFVFECDVDDLAGNRPNLLTTKFSSQLLPDFDLQAPESWVLTLGIGDMVLKSSEGQQETFYYGYFQGTAGRPDYPGYADIGVRDGIIGGEFTIDYSAGTLVNDASKLLKLSDVPDFQVLSTTQKNYNNENTYVQNLESGVNVSEGIVNMNTVMGVGQNSKKPESYIYNIERYKSGEFIYAYSNTETIPSGIVRTAFYNVNPGAIDSFYNSTAYDDFKIHYADPDGSALDGSPDDLSKYTMLGSPSNTPNDDIVIGSYNGLIVSKWYDRELYPADTTVTFQKVTFRMYDAFVAGINYVQDALDDLYRQLNVISGFEAFGGSTVSTDFNNVVSALVNPHRYEETAVSLTSGVDYTVTHNLGKNLVQVAVYNESTWEEVDVDVTIIDSNSLTVTSSGSFTASLVVLI